MRSCWPEFGDGAQNGAFRHFPAQRTGEVSQLWCRPLPAVCKPGLRAATPGANRSVAGCDASRDRRAGHKVGQNPACHNEVGRLTGPAPAGLGAQPRRLSPGATPVTLRLRQYVRGREWRRACRLQPQQTTAQSRWKTAAWGRKRHNPRLLNPRSGILQGECPHVRPGASFRRAMLPIVPMSKKNLASRLAWRRGDPVPPKRRAATFHMFFFKFEVGKGGARWGKNFPFFSPL